MVQRTPSRDLDKIIVRLPDGLRDRIAASAKREGRSMNAEIVSLLEGAYPTPTPTPQLLDQAGRIIDQIAKSPDRPLNYGVRWALADMINQASDSGIFEDEDREHS